jgi:hypothetical protein
LAIKAAENRQNGKNTATPKKRPIAPRFAAIVARTGLVWRPKKDWDEWAKWLRVLVTNDVFLDVFNDTKKMFYDN